ncbi:ImmA/IrrE family metallo-endopeptidase [Lichenibacterium ramalinae]|uniref:ImmA/IrrE family metallo-endopeptidase n=1 Tax=Lichenibacterium ramalinae TaxID=2316527 RepID=UPI0013EAC895|nr:ImmA/IrrE family metallo-endopeptidase [Lichenibacterium ramalinae]
MEDLASLASSAFDHVDGPVPIEELAGSLGVAQVLTVPFDGASGVLLRPDGRRGPLIIVPEAHAERRRRFSIAHEVAHLMLGHLGLARATSEEERQADRLGALLLLPPSRVRSAMADAPPDARRIERLGEAFQVSIDAAARAYAEFHRTPMVAIIARGGVVDRCYGGFGMPTVRLRIGDAVPAGSGASRPAGGRGRFRTCTLRDSSTWFKVPLRRPATFVEQVLRRRPDCSLVVLHEEGAPPLREARTGSGRVPRGQGVHLRAVGCQCPDEVVDRVVAP